MVAINGNLLSKCAGEGCGGDIGIGTGNRYRNPLSSPDLKLSRWYLITIVCIGVRRGDREWWGA